MKFLILLNLLAFLSFAPSSIAEFGEVLDAKTKEALSEMGARFESFTNKNREELENFARQLKLVKESPERLSVIRRDMCETYAKLGELYLDCFKWSRKFSPSMRDQLNQKIEGIQLDRSADIDHRKFLDQIYKTEFSLASRVGEMVDLRRSLQPAWFDLMQTDMSNEALASRKSHAHTEEGKLSKRLYR